MTVTINNIESKFDEIQTRSTWNNKAKTRQELLMHKIHVYPAKFPSFLIPKALDYARRKRVPVSTIGDIFCGCGTTALEARTNGMHFWGCDINPVATLIAKTKRNTYDEKLLQKRYNKIIEKVQQRKRVVPLRILDNERIRYWFKDVQIEELYNLYACIMSVAPKGKYQDFFLVAFSNILKKTSRWLTKSIKPTIDKKKPLHPVLKTFKAQFKMMAKAVAEVNEHESVELRSNIVNQNFLKLRPAKPFLDMLITSPPYVTSYEYADLHQLSTLWLGYTSDHKELRRGTIGSLSHQELNKAQLKTLDPMVLNTYDALVKKKARGPRSVLKYFLDIRATIDKSYDLINPGGLAVFVIGNTTHKGVYIDNAKYLTKCLLGRGFDEIEVFTRTISSKILTPYRDKNGKFSSNKKHRKIYGYEYVVIAQKPNA